MACPLNTIHARLWTTLRAHSDFATLVDTHNQIANLEDESTTLNPQPFGVNYSERSSVEVRQSATRWGVSDDSCCRSVLITYEVGIATDSLLQDDVNEIVWAVRAALENWEDAASGLGSYVWPSGGARCPVEAVQVIQDAQTNQDEKRDRNLPGWVAVCEVEIHARFLASDMISESIVGGS